jgi:hypothetical protein
MSVELESQVHALENRLKALEITNIAAANNSNELREFQLHILSRLREIKSKLLSENGDGQSNNTSSFNSGKPEEYNQLIAENQKLKKENEKLNYRIAILVKAMKEK